MIPPNRLLGPWPIWGGGGPVCALPWPGSPLTPRCEGGPPRASISWRRRAISSSYLSTRISTSWCSGAWLTEPLLDEGLIALKIVDFLPHHFHLLHLALHCGQVTSVISTPQQRLCFARTMLDMTMAAPTPTWTASEWGKAAKVSWMNTHFSDRSHLHRWSHSRTLAGYQWCTPPAGSQAEPCHGGRCTWWSPKINGRSWHPRSEASNLVISKIDSERQERGTRARPASAWFSIAGSMLAAGAKRAQDRSAQTLGKCFDGYLKRLGP